MLDVLAVALAIGLAPGGGEPSAKAPPDETAPALELPSAVEDDPGVLLSVEPGREGAVVLTDGRTIPGEVVELKREKVYVRGPDASTTTIPLPLVRGVVRLVFPWGALEGRRDVRVVTSTGRVLAGRSVVTGRGHGPRLPGGERARRAEVTSIHRARVAQALQPVQRHPTRLPRSCPGGRPRRRLARRHR
jgi:hypothetical protein